MKLQKKVIIVPDGMADTPNMRLHGNTPLGSAATYTMDELACRSELGLVRTVPAGLLPGSDTANMSIMGYDPAQYYCGRASLEASALGVQINEAENAFRLNFITLEEASCPFGEKRLLDFSAGNISNGMAMELLTDLRKAFVDSSFFLHFGSGYHHLAIGPDSRWTKATPPHDMVGQPIAQHIKCDKNTADFMQKAHLFLSNHPLNKRLASSGRAQANAIWIWGAGPQTKLPDFHSQTSHRGAVITATDVIVGLAKCAGLDVMHVKGADGTLHTNYHGKAMAAVQAFVTEKYDFVYLHIEAPDAVSHQGKIEDKIAAIEKVDQQVVHVIREELKQRGIDYRMMVLPDHPTPVHLRTHTSDPVPFFIYDSTRSDIKHSLSFTEECAKRSGIYYGSAHELLQSFLAPKQLLVSGDRVERRRYYG